jgi:hypothetical protein
VRTLTLSLADRHEALVLKLTALAGEVRAVAARRPELGVPAEAVAVAEALLHDAGPFVRGLGPLPAVAPSYGGLAVELSQVLAGLEAFELRHTRWDNVQQCIVWQLGRGVTAPLRRVRPRLIAPVAETRSAEADRIRRKIAQRLHWLMSGRRDEQPSGVGVLEDQGGVGAAEAE